MLYDEYDQDYRRDRTSLLMVRASIAGTQVSGSQAGAGYCAGLSTVRVQHTVRVPYVPVVIFHVVRTEYQYGTVLQELVLGGGGYNILRVLYEYGYEYSIGTVARTTRYRTVGLRDLWETYH